MMNKSTWLLAMIIIATVVTPAFADENTIDKLTASISEVRQNSKTPLAYLYEDLDDDERNSLAELLQMQLENEVSGICSTEADCPFGAPGVAGRGPVFYWIVSQLTEFDVDVEIAVFSPVSTFSDDYMKSRNWKRHGYHVQIRRLVFVDCRKYRNPENGFWYCPVDVGDDDWWQVCDCQYR